MGMISGMIRGMIMGMLRGMIMGMIRGIEIMGNGYDKGYRNNG